MKILTITSLYPNHMEPRHGIFIETRLKQLRARYPQLEQAVIAPVPWFPFAHRCFGRYGQYARIKQEECRDGIVIYHPRYLVLPKIGMLLTPLFLAWSIWRCARQLRRLGFEAEIIDGHYFYPDGVAIALAARWLKLPFVITARGSDINLIADLPWPRRMIAWAGRQASHMITVCESLKTRLAALTQQNNITVLRNGVDAQTFYFSNDHQQQQLRLRLGLSLNARVMLSVGNLVTLKGHDLAIRALAALPGGQLVILGDGPLRGELTALAEALGVSSRVIFTGVVPQSELIRYYRAADLLVLLSSREGWANVLLESMACGTPVVATRVGGSPEVVTDAVAGLLVERRLNDIVAGVERLLAKPPPRLATRQFAERFSWQMTSEGQYLLFSRALKSQPGVSGVRGMP